MIRTLFATHYHEMTELEGRLSGVKNLNVDVAEENGNVVFLHKIVEGSASRSYGIHVAKLAGVPSQLLENARMHLADLEESSRRTEDSIAEDVRRDGSGDAAVDGASEEIHQMSMFELAPNTLVKRLKELDLMQTTPSEALRILEELKEYI